MRTHVRSHRRRTGKGSSTTVKQHYRGRKKPVQTEIIVGGLGDHRPDKAFDHEQLEAGMRVEREHTKNPSIAKEIAKDHLTEDKNYYRKLRTMEHKKYVDTSGYAWDDKEQYERYQKAKRS